MNMILNEGVIFTDTSAAMKSEMIRQLDLLKETTPTEWEKAVFESLTGYRRDDVDWDVPGSQAAYYMWIRSFDSLISELKEEGYVNVVEKGANRKVLRKAEGDPKLEFSQFVYPHRQPQ